MRELVFRPAEICLHHRQRRGDDRARAITGSGHQADGAQGLAGLPPLRDILARRSFAIATGHCFANHGGAKTIFVDS